MNSLNSLQTNFQNFLLSDEQTIQKNVISTPHVSALERLTIYKHAYESRLIECLASNYPYLKIHLGEEQFYELGLLYLIHHPSKYRSIRWFGDKLSHFLSSYSNQPYLAELAEFEWKMTLTFDAADEKILTIEEMATVSPDLWPTMTLIVHSSVQRLNFHWNSVQLWQAIDKQTTLKPSKNDTLSSWVLWREKNYINRFYSLDNEEKEALETIIEGNTFENLCQLIYQWNTYEEVSLKAATFLKKWIQLGLISKIQFNKDE